VRDLGPDELFLDPALDWQPVSPKLVTERRIPLLLLVAGSAVCAIIAGTTSLSASGRIIWWTMAAAAMGLAAVGWFVVVPRTATSWRYAERDDDLLVRRGRLFKRLTVVPYGRMQVIDVRANPVSQRLGIATVTLVTASADTDATIPGVPVDVAHELRDRLAAKGEATAAGL
jgi:membrane protein YdbS with pleckstrin-like domain